MDIRLLRMDPKTAGFLVKALADDTKSDKEIEGKLDALAKNRTITELARFGQPFSPDGARVELEKDKQGIKVGNGEVLPGGLTLELEPTVTPSGWIDLRFSFCRSLPESTNRIETENTLTSALIKADRWEIMADWGDEKLTTLLVGRFSGVTAIEAGATGRLAEANYDSEIRWCEPADLKTFRQATEETRAKAAEWLFGKGKPIATSGLRMRSGQRTTQENVLEWIHDNNGWDTAYLGWILDFKSTISPDGKLIDFELYSEWNPRDAKRPPSSPEFKYSFATTCPSGSTMVIEPNSQRGMGPIPVIFITPTVRIATEGKEPPARSAPPAEGNIGTVIYPAHPSLMRKLAEVTRFDPNANPGIVAEPLLSDLLKKLGLDFPKGTSAHFDASACRVMMSHDLKGHQNLQAILDKYGLSWPQQDKGAP